MPQFSLMAHQQEGVDFLDSVDGIGALLYDPGVGKTGTTLSWVDRLAARQGEVRVLVVAPLTATDTWVLQVPGFMDSTVKARLLEGSTLKILDKIKASRDWMGVTDSRVSINHRGNTNKVTVLSMSSGALSTFCTTAKRPNMVKVLQAVRKYKPHVIVLDESHQAKAATSNISKAVYQIGQLAPHRIILTGTVNPHSALDCYGQWRFLAPWTFSDQYGLAFTEDPLRMTREQKMSIKPWSWKRFRDRYAETFTPRGAPMGAIQIGDMRADMIQELHDRVAERSHVVKKEDALDLPPVTDVDIMVDLTPAERRTYIQMTDELAAELVSGELLEAKNALAKYMKLRQITAGFLRDTETGEVHVVGHSKQKAVAEVVNTQLAGENRIVVFAYFKSEVAAIANLLKKRGRVVEVVTGATPNKERLAVRQRFGDVTNNPTPTVLVAQSRVMSLSVNELVTAQHAVFASYSERRDDWVQQRGRLDRNGQQGSHVTFWNVLCRDSVDEVMLQAHKHRGDLEAALLSHVQSFVRTPRNRRNTKVA